jgi:hypothetical protein
MSLEASRSSEQLMVIFLCMWCSQCPYINNRNKISGVVICLLLEREGREKHRGPVKGGTSCGRRGYVCMYCKQKTIKMLGFMNEVAHHLITPSFFCLVL